MRIIEERNGQLAFHVGQAVIDERRSRLRAVADDSCRRCGAPRVHPWRLCAEHAKAMLDELGEARAPFAAAA